MPMNFAEFMGIFPHASPWQKKDFGFSLENPKSFFASLYPLVFLPGGQAASDVALGFVEIQHLFDLAVKRAVDPLQPLAQILMYGYL